MNDKRRKNQCRARTRQGRPCRAAATEGGLCFFHANPNKAAELGRVGGRRSRHPLGCAADPPRDLKSMNGVRDVLSRLIEDVYSGKVSPRIAGSVAPLLNLQMRAIQATDLEMRIARLEQSRQEDREASKDMPESRADGGKDGENSGESV